MIKRVAILFPGGGADRTSVRLEDTRFAGTAAALRAVGLGVEAAPYADEAADDIRAQLLGVDGVLVWVNPIEGDRPRSTLNALLAEVSRQGVFVSAHPDIIEKLGTKEILYRTRTMPWGCDTRLYETPDRMRRDLPARLRTIGACVVKQVRGNGGNGVWKVELADPPVADASDEMRVRVRHAKRGSVESQMRLAHFFDLCAPYFAAGGGMIDQPYQPRLPDGMIRCYMVHDRIAGFGEQLVNALYPAAPGSDPATAPEPGQRLYYPPTRPDLQPLRVRMEEEWLPELCRRIDVGRFDLPVIWDADFLYGPKDADGADSYVLCEINVSSVYPFPDSALRPLAEATRARLI